MDEHGQAPAGRASAARSSSRARTSSRGYENNPEANATSFTDGWFRTGDQGVLDADGYLTLIGRLKELINRGGEKISPREIDEVLLAHPAVAEAVCFGVAASDVGRGSRGRRRPARDRRPRRTCWRYCRERLADFKRPKQIYITETIPRTATGKIQRRVVAQAFAAQSLVKIRHRRRRRDRRLHRRAPRARRRRRRAVRARPAPARRCRSAACASRAPTATSRCSPTVAAISPRSGMPTSSFSASRRTA